jgi:competence protein ComEC
LILLARLAGAKLLLTSDCTGLVEKALLDQASWPRSDLLKVAHHGSKMTTSADFLACVKPKAAIVSVGPNLYGHPAADTLHRLDQACCPVLRTDQQGAIQLKISRGTWRISSMQAWRP